MQRVKTRRRVAKAATLKDWATRLPNHKGDLLRLKLTTAVVKAGDAGKACCWADWRGQWQGALRQMANIATVEVVVKDCDQQAETEETVARLYQVLTDFGGLPNLKSLHVQGFCRAMPISVVAGLLQQSARLTELRLAHVELSGNPTDLEAFTSSLSKHAALKNLKLHSCAFYKTLDPQGKNSDQPDTAFLDSIMAGVALSESLEYLYLAPTSPSALGSVSCQSIQALRQATQLTSLCFYDEIDDFFTKGPHNKNLSPLDALTDLLASNQTALKQLHLPFLPTRHYCQQLHKALRSNTTLRGLALETFDQGPRDREPLALVAQGLEENSHLEHFALLGPASRIRDNPDLLQSFAHVLEVNYTLQELNIADLMTSPGIRERVDFLSQLNVKGRRHWIQDKYQNHQNLDAQIRLLQHLAQETDDVFYYLSHMNPSLIGNLIIC